MESTNLSPLETACQAVKGPTNLAHLLTERLQKALKPRSVSKASVSRWKKEGVPAEVCPDIEALTGVRCEDLRPDVNWSVLRNQQPASMARLSDDTGDDITFDTAGSG